MPQLAPGCLILHGFTSSLDTVSILAPRVEALGMAYRMPVLRGHGMRPTDLEGVRWEQWVEDARTALFELTQDGRPAVVAGLSMGGLIALDLGVEHPGRVRAVVSIATCLRFANPLVYLLPAIQAGLPYWHGEPRYADPELAQFDTNYRSFPTRAFGELFAYAHVVRRKLPRFDRPVLILQSTHDTTVKPKSAEYIYREIRSRDKEIAWFHRTEHEMLRDVEKEAVAGRIVEFLQRLHDEGRDAAKAAEGARAG